MSENQIGQARTPAGVPTGGQFAASTKAESGVALNALGETSGDVAYREAHAIPAPTPRPESINLVSNREWIASMPLDVRVALASIERTGAAVNEYEDGPIFWEAEADFHGASRSLGAVISTVCDAVSDYCERFDRTDVATQGAGMSEDVSKVIGFIRTDTMRGSYEEGMARLMRWSGMDTSRFDDEDDD